MKYEHSGHGEHQKQTFFSLFVSFFVPVVHLWSQLLFQTPSIWTHTCLQVNSRWFCVFLFFLITKHQNCQHWCFISSCQRSDQHSCLACIILNDSPRRPASSENDGVPEAQTGADCGSRRSQITMTSQTQRSQTCNSTEAADRASRQPKMRWDWEILVIPGPPRSRHFGVKSNLFASTLNVHQMCSSVMSSKLKDLWQNKTESTIFYTIIHRKFLKSNRVYKLKCFIFRTF